jgi:hypothetical protein
MKVKEAISSSNNNCPFTPPLFWSKAEGSGWRNVNTLKFLDLSLAGCKD